jgi:uncharacterized damage-inducible protein DinB
MLDFYRETAVWKCSGMSDEDLRKVIVPSGWSMLGMLNHLAYVEQNWFQVVFAGEPEANFPVPWTDEDPDADFRVGPDQSTASVLDFYEECCERSREITKNASLDDITATWPEDRPPERRPNLRWILVHLIEETARHAGHMDVARELIDGSTGE